MRREHGPALLAQHPGQHQRVADLAQDLLGGQQRLQCVGRSALLGEQRAQIAEHAAFAELCAELGIVFIGPPPDAMRRLGDKIGSKLIAEKAGVPVAPWSGGPVRSLEDARADKVIGKSQEARVVVGVPASELAVLQARTTEALAELFIVSEVELVAADEVSVTVEPARGEKCPRCWNYRELGVDAAHPEVCARCADALAMAGE